MCLQDLQLARAVLVETKDIVAAALGSFQALDQDPARVGFLILGPEAGTVGVRMGADLAFCVGGLLAPGNQIDARTFDIWTHGEIITLPVWLDFSAAASCRLYVYSLPQGAKQLQTLATTGKF